MAPVIGKLYWNPENPIERVRVMPGYADHPTPVKRGPYVIVTKTDGRPSRHIPLKGNPTLETGDTSPAPPQQVGLDGLESMVLDYIEDDFFSLAEILFIVEDALFDSRESPAVAADCVVRSLLAKGLARLYVGLNFGEEEEEKPIDTAAVERWLSPEMWTIPLTGREHVRLFITPAGEREHLLN